MQQMQTATERCACELPVPLWLGASPKSTSTRPPQVTLAEMDAVANKFGPGEALGIHKANKWKAARNACA